MRIKVTLLTFVCFIAAISKVAAQQNTNFFEAGVSGMFGSQKSVYQNGFGVNAGYMWRLSPSFNLGPDFSVNSIPGRIGVGDLQTFSVIVDVDYFPEKLIGSMTKRESTFLKGFYFFSGIGHNFKSNDVFDENGLNAFHFGLGYVFPATSRSFYVSLCENGFALKPGFTDEQVKNNAIFTIAAGVHF